jgi:hypothetical protein
VEHSDWLGGGGVVEGEGSAALEDFHTAYVCLHLNLFYG